MNKKFIFILWSKWHVANFDMPMWCQFRWHMSSSNLINLMTLIWNLPLNFDVAFCNWLDKFLPPTIISLFNEHDLTNTLLMNIHINKSIYHHLTYIIWTWTIIWHIFLDMNHNWTYIIWTWTIARHTLSCWTWTINRN